MNSELKHIFGRDVSWLIERYCGDDFYLIRNGGPELYEEFVCNTKNECIQFLARRLQRRLSYYVTGDEYGAVFYIEYVKQSLYEKKTIDINVKLFWKGKEYDNEYEIYTELTNAKNKLPIYLISQQVKNKNNENMEESRIELYIDNIIDIKGTLTKEVQHGKEKAVIFDDSEDGTHGSDDDDYNTFDNSELGKTIRHAHFLDYGQNDYYR